MMKLEKVERALQEAYGPASVTTILVEFLIDYTREHGASLPPLEAIITRVRRGWKRASLDERRER